MSRSVQRFVVGAGIAAALWAVVLVAPAAAHVNASGAPAGGGATTVTFSFTHGCEQSPTTSLRIQLPANASAVTPQDPPGWTSRVADGELVWTGGSIPSGAPGLFTAAMTIAGAAGDVVYFPTIQGCPDGEEPWIDKTPDAGADQAAPRITLTETVTSTAPASTTALAPSSTTTVPASTSTAPVTASTPRPGTTAAPASAPAASGVNPVLIAAVVVAVLLIGGGALMATRRGRSPDA